jgi:hypothetical protein
MPSTSDDCSVIQLYTSTTYLLPPRAFCTLPMSDGGVTWTRAYLCLVEERLLILVVVTADSVSDLSK